MHRYLIVVVWTIVATKIRADRVPSAANIEDYDDPVLREVFRSSQVPGAGSPNSQNAAAPQPNVVQSTSSNNSRSNGNVAAPYSAPSSTYGPSAASNYSPGYASQGAQQQGYGQQYPGFSSGFNQQQQQQSPAYQLGSVAAQGAQAFVQGAQQVGRVFGIESYATGNNGSPYELPLNGGFFGRR